ncbi:hypothetical protein cypCar_00019424 [Cyprinus carpio]|nr:hypothetical protein cypCar_00019424 [Cyprinus carpio]
MEIVPSSANVMLRKTQAEIEKLLITDDQIHCLKCQMSMLHRLQSQRLQIHFGNKELKEITVRCQELIQKRERGQQELSESVKFLKDKLKEIKVECQKLIQERERGQQDLSEAVKSFKVSITRCKVQHKRPWENIEKVFTELICSLEKKRSEIKEQIRDQEKTEIDRAGLHKHLDQDDRTQKNTNSRD